MHHPERWPDAAWDAYVEALHALVRPDIEPDPDDWRAWRDRPHWPPARRSPWVLCPCHRFGDPVKWDELGYPIWPKRGPADPDSLDNMREQEILAWIAEDPAGRAFINPQVQKALAFIERFNPAKRKAVTP